jgi:hypothetical protein
MVSDAVPKVSGPAVLTHVLLLLLLTGTDTGHH